MSQHIPATTPCTIFAIDTPSSRETNTTRPTWPLKSFVYKKNTR